MKEPKSNGKTMKQLLALRKSSKSRDKKIKWTGAIDGLKGRDAWRTWYMKQPNSTEKKRRSL